MLLTKDTAVYEDGVYKWTFPQQSFKWIFKKLTSSQDRILYGFAYPDGVDSSVLIETNKEQNTIVELEYMDTEFLFRVQTGTDGRSVVFEDVLGLEIELTNTDSL